VHRAGQRHVGEVGLRVAEELRRVRPEVERGVGVLGERRALGRRQPRVEDDGDDAGAEGAEDRGQQRR
jgi:hypothetical protein